MPEAWYYAVGEHRRGPVDLTTLRHLVGEGHVSKDALVWKEGVETGVPASTLLATMDAAGAPAATPAGAPAGAPAAAAPSGQSVRSVLATVGGKLSSLAGVPEIEDVPIASILTDGLREGLSLAAEVEDVFAVGTATTTPPVHSLPAGWPKPRVFWRILAGAIGCYLLLKLGLTEFRNENFLPGLIVTGAFGVPMALMVFFFEMNTPRNVSVYQVGKMCLLGGSLALIATLFLDSILTGAGTGRLLPAMLTGVTEETGKVLALMLIASNMRYRWQLNGLLFGAAVGAGFSGFESSGYAFGSRFLFDTIFWRGMLSPGGHVIWTAMIGAAIWEVKGNRRFEWGMLLHKTVVRRWLVAVILHGLWDTALFPRDYHNAQLFLLLVIGWYYVFAILKQALHEVEAARLAGADVPLPPATAIAAAGTTGSPGPAA